MSNDMGKNCITFCVECLQTDDRKLSVYCVQNPKMYNTTEVKTLIIIITIIIILNKKYHSVKSPTQFALLY